MRVRFYSVVAVGRGSRLARVERAESMLHLFGKGEVDGVIAVTESMTWADLEQGKVKLVLIRDRFGPDQAAAGGTPIEKYGRALVTASSSLVINWGAF